MKAFFLSLSLLATGTFLWGQNTFKQSFRNTTNPVTTIFGAAELADSTIYATGYHATSSFIHASETGMLTAFTPNGDIKWVKEYKPDGVQGVASVIFEDVLWKDDDHLVVNMSSKKGTANSPRFGSGVVKLDKNGNVIWTAYVNGDNSAFVVDPSVTAYHPKINGFTISGIKIKETGGGIPQYFNYCINVGADGQPLPGPENNRFFKPQSGRFEISNTAVDSAGNWFAMEYSASVFFDWMKIPFGAAAPAWMKRVTFQSDTTYAFLNTLSLKNGQILWIGTSIQNLLGAIMITNPDGTVALAKNYAIQGGMMALSHAIETDFGFLVGDYYGITLALDFQGNVLWAYRHVNNIAESNFAPVVAQCADGGFITAGDYSPVDPFMFTATLVKMDKNGLVHGCCSDTLQVEAGEFQVAITDLPFNSVTDTVAVVEWPFKVTDGVVEVQSLCPPDSFSAADSTVCTGGCLTVSTAGLPVGSTPQWTVPAGVTYTLNNDNSVQFCFSNPGVATIKMQLEMKGGCLSPEYQFEIAVVDAVESLQFSLSDSVFCPGNCTTIQIDNFAATTLDYVGGQASPSNPAQICYANEGEFVINAAQMIEGCLRKHSIPVTVENLIDEVPNAFTPNNDQANDVFRPIMDCIPTEYRLRIFDRWGNLVFETTDTQKAWDGTFKNEPAPVDTYIWTATSSEAMRIYKGEITLLR